MTMYVAFIPLGLLIFLFFAIRRPTQLLILFLSTSLGFIAVTRLFFHSPEQFLASLPACMNLGEKNMPAVWAGKSASADSVFFCWQYALSWSHLKEVVFILFCGGGMVFSILLAYLLLRAGRSLAGRIGLDRTVLGLVIISWFVFYLLFMIPKLGLVRDIDLFFGCFLTFAFFAGYLLDRSDISGVPETIALVMGNAAFSIYLFSVAGVS
jgi:hypothetical protein